VQNSATFFYFGDLPVGCCLLALGSNLGNRAELLQTAVRRLNSHQELEIISSSSWHQTEPVGGPANQPLFLNGVVLAETRLTPFQLLEWTQKIEVELGRVNSQRWAARRLDIDLLLYDEQIIDTPELVLPHPRMTYRRFVLEPAAEVAPEMIHPVTGWTISRLFKNLLCRPLYVALAGPAGSHKSTLAQNLKSQFSCQIAADAQRPGSSGDCGRLAADHNSAWKNELTLLQHRVSILDHNRWRSTSAIVVSDFWLNQSLAYASLCLSKKHFQEFQATWQETVVQTLPTTLVLFLDLQPAESRKRIQQKVTDPESKISDHWLDDLRQALIAQTRRPQAGPVLHLDVESSTTHSEINAVIRALAPGNAGK
jgi:2-amino-4-hydroxy-6-hydroxymethyldihydropteridine diphosphokinase